MNPLWVDSEGVLAGRGPTLVVDPGTGRDRYANALAALRRSGKSVAFASFTFDNTEPGSVLSIPDQIGHDSTLPAPTPPPNTRLVDDGIAVWRTGFEKSMLEIETGRVEKVVLARQVRYRIEPDLDRLGVVARLAADNRDCYLFSVEGLIGASPELLVSLRDGRVRTLALAGTATDPGGLETVKISEEHRHVSNSVMSGLDKHVLEIDVIEQVIVPHGAMSHVGTRVEGPARPGTTVADILSDLHPTAAVAGSPTETALDLIREIEPGARGRYAGPVGWIDETGDGVFAIALRCGLFEDDTVTLYAGGGLVAGSEEGAELEETELKLAPMLAALGHPAS
jgi:menaquinone-specific isochorismate synthase